MAPFSPNSPFVIATGVTVALIVGGGGIWFAQPAHREAVHEQVDLLHAKMSALEEQLATKVKTRSAKVKAKFQKLLHAFDKKQDGSLDMSDLDQDRDGDVDSDDIHNMLAHVADDEYMPDWLTKKMVAIFVAIHAALIGVIYLIVHTLHNQRIAKVSDNGKLVLKIIKADGLTNVDKSKDTKDVSDPWVEVKYGAQTAKASKRMGATDQKTNALSPVFEYQVGKTTGFDVDLSQNRKLFVLVHDGGTWAENIRHPSGKPLGSVDIDIVEEFKDRAGQEITKDFHLTLDGDTHAGTITLKGCYNEKPAPQKK